MAEAKQEAKKSSNVARPGQPVSDEVKADNHPYFFPRAGVTIFAKSRKEAEEQLSTMKEGK